MKSEMNTKAGLFQGPSLRNFCLKLMGALFLTVVAPQPFWAQAIRCPGYNPSYGEITGHYPEPKPAPDYFQVPYASNVTPYDPPITRDGEGGYIKDQGGIGRFHQVYGHSGQIYRGPRYRPASTPGIQVPHRRGGSTGSSGGFGCGRSGRH